MKPAPSILAFILAVLPSIALAADSLTLDRYLEQVRTGNDAYRSQATASQGALERKEESSLALSPALFANAQLARDAKLPTIPFFLYDSIVSNNYAFGVSQQTTFGLTARLSYNVGYTNYQSPAFPASGPVAGGITFHDASPRIELTQSLWSNGFGAGTRAQRDLLEAQSLAQHYSQRYASRVSLTQAETAYYRLATARQLVEIATGTLDRARKIHEWSTRRVRLQLADRADELQARAALDQRKLDYRFSQDEERLASRAFNSARGVDSDAVAEQLASPTGEQVQKLEAPIRAGRRDDVRASAEQERATRAGAELQLQKDLPTLELFGAYAANGRGRPLGDAVGDAWSSGRPTEAVGLRFQVPLALGTMSDARAGWRKEQLAAEELYRRRLFDEENDWKDLSERFEQSKQRLSLAQELEQAQQSKLTYEKGRLERGRSTTYQVLLFEQDYSQALIRRLQLQAEVLAVLAQMKLYGERS